MPLFFQLAIAVGAGALLGWLFGFLSSKRTALPPDGRLENELRQQLQQREAELGSTREQLTRSATDLAKAEHHPTGRRQGSPGQSAG
jgi:hypothetical protein